MSYSSDGVRPEAFRLPYELRTATLLVFAVAFPNALYQRIAMKINADGVLDGVLSTFDISAIVWGGIGLVFWLIPRTDFGEVQRFDWTALALTTILVMAPVSGLAWVGLTFLGLYFLITRPDNLSIRRLCWSVLALSYTCLWARLIFRLMSKYILAIDAFLVSLLSGTQSSGNIVTAADGATSLIVLEACSSFSNMSLAMCGWILARGYYGTYGPRRSFIFISLSCLAVVMINTTRIGLIALDPTLYDLVHGPVGANIASLITAVAVIAISVRGARI